MIGPLTIDLLQIIAMKGSSSRFHKTKTQGNFKQSSAVLLISAYCVRNLGFLSLLHEARMKKNKEDP